MTFRSICLIAVASASAKGTAGPCAPYDPFDNQFPWSVDVPLIVAADGSGNCSTIQGAIDLLTGAKAGYRDRYTIHVRAGVYREKVRVPPVTPPLTLQGLGGSPDDVMVVWDDAECPDGPEGCRCNAGRQWDSQTLQVGADDFRASDITVWNSACGNQMGRNFAIAVTADRISFFRVRILGGQDTFYTGFKRVYVQDSFINGTVDFIFGIGSAVFENCEIQGARSGGYLTAHKGNNMSQVDGAAKACDLGWGQSCEAYVFNNCRLTSAYASEKGTYLGRPWHGDWATVAFLNSWMGAHIAPTGWNPWSTGCKPTDTRCTSVFYAEFNSTGPGAVVSERVAWSRQMRSDDVAAYSTKNVLRGWVPADPRTSASVVLV